MQSCFIQSYRLLGLVSIESEVTNLKLFIVWGKKINPTSCTGLVSGWFGHSKPAGNITLSSGLIIEFVFTVILTDISCQHEACFCNCTIHFCVYCPGIY